MASLDQLVHSYFDLIRPWPMETHVEGKSVFVRVPGTEISSSALQVGAAMRKAGRIAADRLLQLERKLELLNDTEAREWRVLKAFLRWKVLRWSGGLQDEATVPEWLRDEGMTQQDFRNRASKARGEEWVHLASLVLREGNPEDALAYLRLAEAQVRWCDLEKHIGARSELWRWLFDWWGLSEGRLPPLRVHGTLLTEFWMAQGLTTRAANLLAYGARVYSLHQLASLSTEQIHAIDGMGQHSAAEVLALLERARRTSAGTN